MGVTIVSTKGQCRVKVTCNTKYLTSQGVDLQSNDHVAVQFREYTCTISDNIQFMQWLCRYVCLYTKNYITGTYHK